MSDSKKEIEEGSALNINFEKRGGLIPGVAQDVKDGTILMLGYVNQEAFEETLKVGMATFWSTSRDELWTKGKTSGDYLKLVNILVDCDQDAIVYQVAPQGSGACHTKDPASGSARRTCFYRSVNLETRELEK
ncbi:MAG: phosphoribosyl-AMP cyclohydrolase [Nitrospinota bacterium]|nr:phosphoribosyl-AMP cyclohydrolase [Nitrospinota bacterium]